MCVEKVQSFEKLIEYGFQYAKGDFTFLVCTLLRMDGEKVIQKN